MEESLTILTFVGGQKWSAKQPKILVQTAITISEPQKYVDSRLFGSPFALGSTLLTFKTLKQ